MDGYGDDFEDDIVKTPPSIDNNKQKIKSNTKKEGNIPIIKSNQIAL